MKFKIVILAIFLYSGIRLSAQTNKVESEFFEVKVLSANQIAWDWSKSLHNGLVIWKAVTPENFYTFGHQVTHRNYTPNKFPVTIALKPKDDYKDQNLITGANKYEMVWNSDGTGMTPRIYIYKAICPTGYVSLGMISAPYNDSNNGPIEPSKNDCACIKKTAKNKDGETIDLVSEAVFISEVDGTEVPIPFWGEYGSNGAKYQTSIHIPKLRQVAKTDYLVLTPNSFYASGSYYNFPDLIPYALNLKFDISMDEKPELSRPVLTSHTPPTSKELASLAKTIEFEVPFFTVQDNKYESFIEQYLSSPVYTVLKRTYYKNIGKFSCPLNGAEATYNYTISNSITKEDNWEKAWGISVGVTVGAGFKVGVVDATVEVSVENSYSYSWGGSSSETKETSSSYEVKLEPGQTAVVLQEVSEYSVYRKINGERENTPFSRYTQGEDEFFPLYYNDPEREKSKSGSEEKSDASKGNIAGISAYGKYFVELKPDGRLIINTLDDDAKICTGVKIANENPARVNVALGKSAKQSSTFVSTIFPNGGLPSYAVDGNTDGNYKNNSVSHTNSEVNPWWEVDLGREYDIDEIIVWNRADCCMERLNNFVITTSTTPFSGSASIPYGAISYGKQGVWAAFQKSMAVTGKGKARYVRISLEGTGELSLTEVQIFAK